MARNSAHTDAKRIVDCLLGKKAQDVRLMDMRAATDIADYFVVCHGDSDTHVKAITEAVLDGMQGRGRRPWHTEGVQHLRWVLIDYVDVVVHVFQKDERDFYGLERLWNDAKTTAFGDPA
ncbi:MAG: ribosome silencing factor [bacterium]|nr:ribosome silencing factor [bacterium]